MTQNQLAYLRYEEDVRANKAKERAADAQARAAESQAETARRNQEVNAAKLYETTILGSKIPISGLAYDAGKSNSVRNVSAKSGKIKGEGTSLGRMLEPVLTPFLRYKQY